MINWLSNVGLLRDRVMVYSAGTESQYAHWASITDQSLNKVYTATSTVTPCWAGVVDPCQTLGKIFGPTFNVAQSSYRPRAAES